MERIRAMGEPSGRYIMVNVPGAQIEAVENGQRRHPPHRCGRQGRPADAAPFEQIYQVNFNPFWTVPASIIKKDLIPKMQKEPNYLTEHNIRIFNQQGIELQPAQVNWNSDEAVNYMFKQDPGDQNSLGVMKLSFHNPHQVYMHDTPAKNLFGSDYRFEVRRAACASTMCASWSPGCCATRATTAPWWTRRSAPASGWTSR